MRENNFALLVKSPGDDGQQLLTTGSSYVYRCKELIEEGADVNAEDYSGTPLTAAVENGHHKLVELLLNTGADVDQRDFFGETPIFYAAY